MGTNLSPTAALRRFGFSRTIKGALILGFIIGLFVTGQGLGYAETFTDEKSRTDLATSLSGAPALGILYGEPKDILSTAGYMVYRTTPIMGLITAIWGLMTVTKLLRGQEEDGRMEAIVTGSTTNRQASWHIFMGFIGSIVLSFTIAALIIVGVGRMPNVDASVYACLLITAAIFLPGLLFAGVGVFVSQFSVMRRRALMYGLIPLAILFAMRGFANTIEDWYWLKRFTPFGWADKISPVSDTQLVWILPFLLVIPIVAIGIYLVGKRDLGASLIKESETVKSHNFLLGSPLQMAVRQQIGIFAIWAVSGLFVSSLIAAIANIAANAVVDAPEIKDVIGKLGGSVDDMALAFLGTGIILVVLLLLLMVTVGITAIRKDEAKQYLDNLLVQPVMRSKWLASRIGVLAIASVVIALITELATFLIANSLGIHVDAADLFLVSIALTGTVIFTLGLGTLMYGFLPRFAATTMYTVIAWSFLVDVIQSIVKLDDIVLKSSLFHYISPSLTETPDWATFAWLVSLGIVMAIVGIFAFTRRDIIAE